MMFASSTTSCAAMLKERVCFRSKLKFTRWQRRVLKVQQRKKKTPKGLQKFKQDFSTFMLIRLSPKLSRF